MVQVNVTESNDIRRDDSSRARDCARTADKSEQKRWPKGTVLLGRYKIIDTLGEGGMSVVYLVQRTTDGELFAVKTLNHQLVRGSEGRKSIFNELRTWMDLPEHPNLTACRFFRTIDDRITVFAEYVNGGSLKTAILNRQLLELERILDVAIQGAWGLHAAHVWGVVHQDVKPANILLTKENVVKVTDFGLSGIEVYRCPDDDRAEAKNHLVSTRGMTVAYCSPEQCQSQKLDYRTDIWSWGISILEMFVGKAAWEFGIAAPAFLEDYYKKDSQAPYPVMPVELAAILRQCLAIEPASRWPNCLCLAQELSSLYNKLLGKNYSRATPSFPTKRKPTATAYQRTDLFGQNWTDPRQWLEKAVKASKGLHEVKESDYRSVQSSGLGPILIDLEIAEEAQGIYLELIKDGRTELQAELGELTGHKATIQVCANDLQGAMSSYSQAIMRYRQIADSDVDDNLRIKLTQVLMGRGCVKHQLRQLDSALIDFQQSIDLLKQILSSGFQEYPTFSLVYALTNKAIALAQLDKLEESFATFDEAETTIHYLQQNTGKSYDTPLAFLYMNKVSFYDAKMQCEEALRDSERCVKLWEKICHVDQPRQKMTQLLIALINYVVKLTACDHYELALTSLRKASDLVATLTDFLNEDSYNYYQAIITSNHAVILLAMDRNEEALSLINQAIQLVDRLISLQGRSEYESMFQQMRMYQVKIYKKLKKHQEAANAIDLVIDSLDRLISIEKRTDLLTIFADAKYLKVQTLVDLVETASACQVAQELLSFCQTKRLEKASSYWDDLYIQTQQLIQQLTRQP